MIGWARFPIQASKEEYCYISVLIYTIKILHLLIKTTKNISISVSSLNELTEARNRLDQESKEQQVSIHKWQRRCCDINDRFYNQ